jgi:ornithine decarboxylase
MTSDDINRLMPELRKNPGIARLGVHFHRKSQNTGNWNLKSMLEEMLSEETLEAICLMNIGGGIPIDYRNSKATNISYITDKIAELGKWLESKGIKMIMEPGRPLSGPPVKLVTSITSISGRHITVNASVYNSSLDTIIVPHKLLVEGEGEGNSYIIKGCTPCSMDIFRYDVLLNDPKVGDSITFLNAGAYNFTSTFCNLEKPPTVIVE